MSDNQGKPLLSTKSIVIIGLSVACVFILIPCAVIVALLVIGRGYVNSIERTVNEPPKASAPHDRL